jgi:hypothetical protein
MALGIVREGSARQFNGRIGIAAGPVPVGHLDIQLAADIPRL